MADWVGIVQVVCHALSACVRLVATSLQFAAMLFLQSCAADGDVRGTQEQENVQSKCQLAVLYSSFVRSRNSLADADVPHSSGDSYTAAQIRERVAEWYSLSLKRLQRSTVTLLAFLPRVRMRSLASCCVCCVTS